MKVYQFKSDHEGKVVVPVKSKLLKCACIDGEITFFFLCEPGFKEFEQYILLAMPTDSEIPDGYVYVDTVIEGEYIWHIFNKVA